MSSQIMITDERIRTLLPIYLVTAGMDHKQLPVSRAAFPFYQLLCVLKGSGICTDASGDHILTEGMTLFTAKGAPAAYHGTSGDFTTAWITFDGPQAEAILEYASATDSAILKNEVIRALICDLWKYVTRNAPPDVLSHRVYELIVTFFGAINEGKKPPKLRRAKDFIAAHYAEDLSVADIARAVDLSEAQLYRLFHAEEHSSPAGFLRDVRVMHAKELLLASSQMRIAEIATATGFSDAAYFCKVFRSATGMTPRQYREHYRF